MQSQGGFPYPGRSTELDSKARLDLVKGSAGDVSDIGRVHEIGTRLNGNNCGWVSIHILTSPNYIRQRLLTSNLCPLECFKHHAGGTSSMSVSPDAISAQDWTALPWAILEGHLPANVLAAAHALAG